MATNLRTRLTTGGGSVLSNLNGSNPTMTNNGAASNGLTPVNNTFSKGTYTDTLLASGAFDRARATDPSAGPARGGGI